MELGEITRREFLNRSAMLGILTSLYSTGCSILYPSKSFSLPENEFLLLDIHTSIKEAQERIDPLRGYIISFSADYIAKIEQGKLFLSRDYVKEEQLSRAKGVVLQGLRYEGDIGGASSAIYLLDEVPSSIYVRSGFPGYRFDGQVLHKPDLEDSFRVHSISRDGIARLSLNQKTFSLKHGETYSTQRQFRVEIDPQIMQTENESWSRPYSNVKRTSFEVTTQIENLGIYDKGNVEFVR